MDYKRRLSRLVINKVIFSCIRCIIILYISQEPEMTAKKPGAQVQKRHVNNPLVLWSVLHSPKNESECLVTFISSGFMFQEVSFLPRILRFNDTEWQRLQLKNINFLHHKLEFGEPCREEGRASPPMIWCGSVRLHGGTGVSVYWLTWRLPAFRQRLVCHNRSNWLPSKNNKRRRWLKHSGLHRQISRRRKTADCAAP